MKGKQSMASISINETGLRFGDTFTVSFVPPKRYKGGLWARADGYANATSQGVALLYTQFVNLDGRSSQSGPFVLGPTPSWPAGGCDLVVRLVALSGGRTSYLAQTEAVVLP